MKKIGFIINPVAGLGGRAGFKGSDKIENQRKALEKGYQKTAHLRAAECIRQIKDLKNYVVFAPAGEMGGGVLKNLGIRYQQVYPENKTPSRQDTLDCVRMFKDQNVDLIVFCGGDGTARDICEAAGTKIPVLGIPAGVKMYSGCYAINPRIAGSLLKSFLQDQPLTYELREVMDVDEEILGKPSVSPRLYGYLQTINEGVKLQGSKVSSSTNAQEAEILAEYLVKQMAGDTLYIIGPGSTTYRIKERIAKGGTLLGVDAVKNGEIIKKDADEKTLLALTKNAKAVEIIVTCIGGAGFVFGRGNQQISPELIRRVTKEHIRLAVTKSKLAGLRGRPMFVDTGDKKTDQYLCGYYKIHFSARETAVYRIESM